MTFLVDANVLCETMKPSPNPVVIVWMRNLEPELAVDSNILGEIFVGILRMPKGRKRAGLEMWFETVVQNMYCVPWDSACAIRWARLFAELESRGETMPLRDSMIAATALVHNLTVVTRNTRDFKKAGVKVLDPFA